MPRSKAGLNKDMDYEFVTVSDAKGNWIASLLEADGERRWAIVAGNEEARATINKVVNEEVARSGALSWTWVLGDFRQKMAKHGYTVATDTYVSSRLQGRINYERQGNYPVTFIDHGIATTLPPLAPPPSLDDVEDVGKGGLMLAVIRRRGKVVAWIDAADNGRQWLITGDAGATKIVGRLVQARCREHSGWTNWHWLRGTMEQDLQRHGYALAKLAVATPAAGRFDLGRVHQLELKPGQGIVLVDGSRIYQRENISPGRGLSE